MKKLSFVALFLMIATVFSLTVGAAAAPGLTPGPSTTTNYSLPNATVGKAYDVLLVTAPKGNSYTVGKETIAPTAEITGTTELPAGLSINGARLQGFPTLSSKDLAKPIFDAAATDGKVDGKNFDDWFKANSGKGTFTFTVEVTSKIPEQPVNSAGTIYIAYKTEKSELTLNLYVNAAGETAAAPGNTTGTNSDGTAPQTGVPGVATTAGILAIAAVTAVGTGVVRSRRSK